MTWSKNKDAGHNGFNVCAFSHPGTGGFCKVMCLSEQNASVLYIEHEWYFFPKIIIMTDCQWEGLGRDVQKVDSV